MSTHGEIEMAIDMTELVEHRLAGPPRAAPVLDLSIAATTTVPFARDDDLHRALDKTTTTTPASSQTRRPDPQYVTGIACQSTSVSAHPAPECAVC